MIYFVYPSPIGSIGILAEDGEILKIDLETPIKPSGKPESVVKTLVDELDRYFSGDLKNFSIPLVLKGEGFSQDVLHAIQTIPYGMTITYRELAIRSGHSRAIRAVGSVCAKNPFPLLIPCHRIIRSDGKIGNYQAGTERKRFLVDMEKSHF